MRTVDAVWCEFCEEQVADFAKTCSECGRAWCSACDRERKYGNNRPLACADEACDANYPYRAADVAADNE